MKAILIIVSLMFAALGRAYTVVPIVGNDLTTNANYDVALSNALVRLGYPPAATLATNGVSPDSVNSALAQLGYPAAGAIVKSVAVFATNGQYVIAPFTNGTSYINYTNVIAQTGGGGGGGGAGTNNWRVTPNIIAASASRVDVAAAVAAALPGQVVGVPAGTSVWTAPITVQGITLVAYGTNSTPQVTILDSNRIYDGTFMQPMLVIQTTNTPTRITGFDIEPGGATNTTYYKGKIIVNDNGLAGGSWRVDNCWFGPLLDATFKVYQFTNPAPGLIDHCKFSGTHEQIQVYGISANDSYSDVMMSIPSTLGGSNLLVCEQNWVTNAAPNSTSSQFLDVEAGGVACVRSNVLFNSTLSVHGLDTSGRNRSGKQLEVIGNYFYFDGAQFGGPNQIVDYRGGYGVVYSNTIVTNGASMSVGFLGSSKYYRSVSTTDSWQPWGPADGGHLSPWDVLRSTNSDSGTATATGSFCQDNTKSWVTNQWVGYTLVNMDVTNLYVQSWNGGANSITNRYCPLSVVSSNNGNTLFWTPTSWASQGLLSITSGTKYKLYDVYPGIDFPGYGGGDVISHSGPNLYDFYTPTNTALNAAAYPRQTLYGIYYWSNTLNGVLINNSSSWAPGNAGYANIVNGRDFTNGVPKPGYTPLVFPHPLNN